VGLRYRGRPSGQQMYCYSNPLGGCSPAHFLTHERSAFHDARVQEATIKLNEVLNEIGLDPEGRRLAILEEPGGVVLAWVFEAEVVILHCGERIEFENELTI
jgi:hypothetical protein